MTRKICLAAAIQKYKCPIRIFTVHNGGQQDMYVCEVQLTKSRDVAGQTEERIRRVLDSGKTWDALMASITGVAQFLPTPQQEEQRQARSKSKKGARKAVVAA